MLKSTFMMILLLVIYVIVAVTCVFEKRLLLALYWLSAATLNLAVLLMNK